MRAIVYDSINVQPPFFEMRFFYWGDRASYVFVPSNFGRAVLPKPPNDRRAVKWRHGQKTGVNMNYSEIINTFKNTPTKNWDNLFEKYNRDDLKMIVFVLLCSVFDTQDALAGRIQLQ